MAHFVWHTLPICESSKRAPPTRTRVPSGSARRSMPSVVTFSAKSPSATSRPMACAFSMDSHAKSDTCRCQSPACASPATPRFASMAAPPAHGVLRPPLRRDVFTDRTRPSLHSSILSALLPNA